MDFGEQPGAFTVHHPKDPCKQTFRRYSGRQPGKLDVHTSRSYTQTCVPPKALARDPRRVATAEPARVPPPPRIVQTLVAVRAEAIPLGLNQLA